MADANEHTTALRQSSLKARDTSDRAVRTVEEVQQKLEALARFDAVSRDTSAQLQAVNALAERVTSKVKAFDQQHETLEHALVESRKLNEMVRDMDAQIARLNEGSPLVTRIEETFAKLEHLQLQTTTELVEADRVRQAHSELLEQHRADTTELLETLQGRVDHLGLAKNAIDALGDRLSTAQSTLADVERRLAAVSTGDEAARNLDEKIDELSLRVGKLDAEARTLEQRQEALTALEVRLTEVEEAAKSTGRHLEGLAERRQELDALRATLTEFDAIHARGEALTNRLRADKQELAQFADRTASFMRDAPAISASVESLKRTLAEVEESAGRATGMKPMVDELASQAERLAARLQITKDLQARLDELHALSVEVDQKLTRQLARQAEIEAVRIACDGLSTRLTDAQHNYATLTAAQGKLASLPGQIAELEKSVGVARSEVLRLQHEEVLPAQAQMLKDRTSQYAP
jgi:DNA repair ATPase RecN